MTDGRYRDCDMATSRRTLTPAGKALRKILEGNETRENLDAELRTVMMNAATGEGTNDLGLPKLTTAAVEALRDGRLGNSIYKAMQRATQDGTAGKWLWLTVADLQYQHLVSAEAQRRSKGPGAHRDGWREELLREDSPWETKVKTIYRWIARHSDEGLLELRRDKWQTMYQSVKKSMKTRNPAQQVRICIWELVAHWGLNVETIREDVTLGGERRSRDWWDGVIADMVSGSTEQQQLQQY